MTYPDWKLVVVDQSDGDETLQLARTYKAQIPQLVYLRLDQKNASAARNLAMESARGDVLAFLDDDCTVGPDWLDRVIEAFEREPGANLIFGAVNAMEHDPAEVFVPTYDLRRERCLRGARDSLRVRAMGASMYMRLGSWALPRFDLLLGPGARFRSSQDNDYAYRVLADGQLILETPLIVVTHHGARPYAGGIGKAKWRDYMYGAGASHAKLLRCGEWVMVAVIVDKLARYVAGIRPQKAFVHQPTHFGRLLMYMRGLRDGFKTPIDRHARVFIPALGKSSTLA